MHFDLRRALFLLVPVSASCAGWQSGATVEIPSSPASWEEPQAPSDLPRLSYDPLDPESRAVARWLADESSSFDAVAFAVDVQRYGDARSMIPVAIALLGTRRIDLHIVATALEAELCAAAHQSACADSKYEQVSLSWGEKDTALDRLDKEASVEGILLLQRDDRLAHALDAVGEARFHVAKRAWEHAAGHEPPAFVGPKSHDALMAFARDKALPWLKARLTAIETVEKAYVRVEEIEPIAPPRWVMAASEQVGAMWTGYCDAARTIVPRPDDWDPEIGEAYAAASSNACELLMRRARDAYERCAQTASDYGLTGDVRDRCQAWLDAHR